MKKGKIHYAWIILIACCLLQAGGIGTLSNTSAVFIANICQDRGLHFVNKDFVKTFDEKYDTGTEEGQIALFGSVQDYEAFRDKGFIKDMEKMTPDQMTAAVAEAGYTSLDAYTKIATNEKITGAYTDMYKQAVNAAVSTFTMYMMVQGFVNAVLLPFAGKLISKFNIRWLVVIGMVVITATFATMSRFTAMWQWYAAGIILGIGSTLIFTLPAPILVRTWFVKKVGLAMGIQAAFANLGGAVMAIVVAKFIDAGGWSMAYWATAIVSAILVIPAAIFLIRSRPSDMGLLPYGAEETAASAAPGKAPTVALPGISAKVALRTITFLAIALGAGLMAFVQVFANIFSSFGTAMDMTMVQSAWIASCALYGGVFFKIAIGWLNDKFGIRKSTSVSLIISIAAFVLLILSTKVASNTLALVYVGSVLFGAMSACCGTILPLIVSSAFGYKDFAKIYSYVIMALSISGSLAATLIPRLAGIGQKIGFLGDSTGYAFAFTIAIVFCIIIGVCVFSSIATGKRLLARETAKQAEEAAEAVQV